MIENNGSIEWPSASGLAKIRACIVIEVRGIFGGFNTQMIRSVRRWETLQITSKLKEKKLRQDASSYSPTETCAHPHTHWMTTRIYSQTDKDHLWPLVKAGSTLPDENRASVPLSWLPPNNLPSHHGLGFGCVSTRMGQHRIDYCWSHKTESQGKKEGWW